MRRLGPALLVGALGVAAMVTATSRTVRAQPAMPPGGMGMPDPSAMSGIPRPDPTVPPGKLVVRVIRGDFAHPMVGTDVVLEQPGAAPRTGKVGPDGRANFEGLAPGSTCTVKAQAGEQSVASQQIPMPGEAGVKVMLVFKRDEASELGEHDGVARTDKSLPVGTLVISLVDEADKPLGAMPITVSHGSAPAAGGEPKIEQSQLTTDDKGEARFVAAPGAPGEGLLVTLRKEPLSASSQPFQLSTEHGMRLGLRALARTSDASQLVINRKSHLILDVKDETVEIIENFTIENKAAAPYDPGKAGIVFHLPEKAGGAQQVGEPSPNVTVAGNVVTVRGPLAPGETQVSVGFVMAQQDGSVEISQVLPVRMEQLIGITSRFPGMEVRGDGVSRSEREMGGRTFFILTGGPVAAGATLRLGLAGLPHKSPWAAYAAVIIAGLIALWGMAAGFGAAGRRVQGEVERLEAEKQQLLDELAALERGKAGTAKAEAKHARRHDELMERLERVLRDLDDHHAE